MKNQLLAPVFTLVSLTFFGTLYPFTNSLVAQTPTPKPTSTPNNLETKPTEEKKNTLTFECNNNEKSLLTVARISEKDFQPVVNWHKKYFPDRTKAAEICQTTANKLQDYYDNGQLKKDSSVISQKKDNKSVVVCIEEEKDKGCVKDRILLTINTSDKDKTVQCYLEPKDAGKYSVCALRGDFPMRRIRFSWLLF